MQNGLTCQCQHIGLFQMSAEDVSVLMYGCLVTHNSTSEELLWMGLAKTIWLTLTFNSVLLEGSSSGPVKLT